MPSRDWEEERRFTQFCFAHHTESKAQLMQDLLALFVTDKRGGWFVEFGATNGIELSNTKSLEELYDWSGIVAEPARGWHEALTANRRCIVDTRCVTDRSGDKVLFNETPDKVYSTIDAYSDRDEHGPKRIAGERYEVETVSLNDLIAQSGFEGRLDYLSVDTEGSEYTILNAFDIDRYLPTLITVEHNYQSVPRQKIHQLLSGKGYIRKFTDFSYFDDWYVLDPGRR